MGADSLNASPASLPRVKWAIRSFSCLQARELAQQALQQDTVGQIRHLINEALRKVGLNAIAHDSI